MPRKLAKNKTAHEKFREAARGKPTRFDAAYHAALYANAKDGRVSTGLNEMAIPENELSAEDTARLAELKSAIDAE